MPVSLLAYQFLDQSFMIPYEKWFWYENLSFGKYVSKWRSNFREFLSYFINNRMSYSILCFTISWFYLNLIMDLRIIWLLITLEIKPLTIPKRRYSYYLWWVLSGGFYNLTSWDPLLHEMLVSYLWVFLCILFYFSFLS